MAFLFSYSKSPPSFATIFHFAVPIALLLCLGCGSNSSQSSLSPSHSSTSQSNSPNTRSSPMTLVYGRGEDSNTLDPIHTDIGEAIKVMVSVFDTLIGYKDDSLELEPGLGTSWSRNEDGTTWVFKLRQGVTFHDGESFAASSVVYTFERLINDSHPGLFDTARPYRTSYTMIESVTATGPLEVTFKLKSPSATFIKNLAMFPVSIVSPKGVEKHGKSFGDHPVGTGPFRFVRWTRDQQIVLEAFDKHWRGRPKVDRVVFVPISESSTRVLQLTRGEVHIADDLPPADLDSLAKSNDIQVQHQTGLNIAYLAMQTEKTPLNDPRVRQAIWHAIDKRELVRIAYSGRAQPAVTVLPPAMWGHHDQLQDREFNIAKAKKLIQQAVGEGKFQVPVSLTLSVMSQSRPYMQQPLRLASFIKDSLAPIGIDVRIDSKPVNQHFDKLTQGHFDLGLSGWSSDNSDPDNFMYPLFDPDNINDHGNNLSRYRSDEMHELLIKAQQELDESKRRHLYLLAQELIVRDAPIVPLVHAHVNIGHRTLVRGFTLHPSTLLNLRHVFFETQP